MVYRDEITVINNKCKFLQNEDGEVIWHRVDILELLMIDDVLLHHRENAVHVLHNSRI